MLRVRGADYQSDSVGSPVSDSDAAFAPRIGGDLETRPTVETGSADAAKIHAESGCDLHGNADVGEVESGLRHKPLSPAACVDMHAWMCDGILEPQIHLHMMNEELMQRRRNAVSAG